MKDINWFSLVLATLTPMFIGYFFYHKAVFGKAWMASVGMTDNPATKVNRIVTLGVSLLFSFLMSFFLLNFNNDGLNQEGDFDTFLHGAWHGTLLAIVVVIPVIVTNGYLGQRAWKNMLINICYWVITLALMGGILDAMNHWENLTMPVGL